MPEMLWNNKIDQAEQFTNTFIHYENDDISIREAACLRALFPSALQDIAQGDFYAGRSERTPVGFIQSHGSAEMGYICRKNVLEAAIENNRIPEDDVERVKKIISFWNGKTTADVAIQMNTLELPIEINNALLSPEKADEWQTEIFAAAYMHRMAEINLDFDKLLQNGIDGIKEIIQNQMFEEKKEKKASAKNLYNSMLDTMELVRECCVYYAKQAEMQMQNANHIRRQELERISQDLWAITKRKPEHLTEAISLFWLYSQMAYLDNFGRMDVYLGDFLVKDLDSGYLTESEALAAITGLFTLIADAHPNFGGRVIIGGIGRRNEKNADRFALFALKAQQIVNREIPQLSLRMYRNMDESLFRAGLDSIINGNLYPFLYNDDIGVPCVGDSFNIPRFEAEQYIMSNCGEYDIEHRSFSSPNGSINYVKILEITLHNGIDPISGKQMLLQTGQLEDFKTFDDLWKAFEEQVKNIVNIITQITLSIYRAASAQAPNLLASILMDDCIKEGKGLLEGVRYCGLVVETHGMITVANSLYAVKKLVYDEKKITAIQLMELLKSNFANGEAERKLLLQAPKFGNDDSEVDEMAEKVVSMIKGITRDAGKILPVDFCLATHISVDAHVYCGQASGATPDGRKSGEPITNSNNPSGGTDKEGVTALLRSMSKIRPIPSAGQVNHVKLSKSIISQNREVVVALVKSFFDMGGNHLCISVLDKQELLDALENPEKNSHILVRIGGYSAQFINLPRELKEEIISRTEH